MSYDQQTDNLIGAFERSRTSVSRIDRLINKDLFEQEQRKLEEKAQRVYDDIPEEIKGVGKKSGIKRLLDGYFVGNGIYDRSGRLRCEVYRLFWNDMYRRAHEVQG